MFFDTAADTLFDVNFARKDMGRDIPHSVLEGMISTLETPSLSEGFDELRVITRKASYYEEIEKS